MESIAGGFYAFTSYSAGAFVLWLAYELYLHRDGSAIGTGPRPDLDSPAPGIPLFGNLFALRRNQHRIHEFWLEMKAAQVDKSRSLTLTIPFNRIIEASSPELIEYVQKTNFPNYMKGPLMSSVVKSVLGEGIFAVDGDKWLTIRKATSKIFSAANFRGVISTAIETDLQKLEIILNRYADSGKEFDLSSLFFGFTLSSFTSMGFSIDVGALSLDEDPAPVPFAVAFDYAQSGITKRAVNPLWKYTELFSEDGRKMLAATKVLDDFAYDIIAQREAEGLHNIVGKGDRANKDGKKDLLSLYMQLRDEHGKPMNRTALRDAVINLIIAGRDTTAQGLSWIFFHLMQQPALIEVLREEVDQFGDANIDYDSYKSLSQIMAVFNEGLRLHPSVPKNVWQAKANDVLPNGTIVEAGDRVRWSDYEMARDPTVWGPDAESFKPSRWITDEGGLMKTDMWKSHWFNGGPRLCLGQNLAQFEASAVIALIVKKFDVKFAPDYLQTTEMSDRVGENTPRYQTSLTLPMLAPLRATISRRQ